MQPGAVVLVAVVLKHNLRGWNVFSRSRTTPYASEHIRRLEKWAIWVDRVAKIFPRSFISANNRRILGNSWKKIRIREALWPKIRVRLYFSKPIGIRLLSSSGKVHFMARTAFAWSVVALVAVTAGCRMCAHPHDYCGPTYTGECGTQCAPNARAGSVLSEPRETFASHEMVPRTGNPYELVPVPDDLVENMPGVEEPVSRVRTASPPRMRRGRPVRYVQR